MEMDTMEIVKEYKFTGSRGTQHQALVKEFLELPEGTTAKFVKGVDFEQDAKKFSLGLRTSLWNKGYKVRINVKGDEVYAAVSGKRVTDEPVVEKA